MSAARVEGFFKYVLLFGITVLFAACGGGGGASAVPSTFAPETGSTASPTSSPFPGASSSLGNRIFNGAYVFTENQRGLYGIIAQTVTQNTRVSIQIAKSYPAIARTVGQGNTIEMAPSLAGMTSIVNDDEAVAYYDIEHWASTPSSEQQSPAASIEQAAQIAHGAHKLFGVTPDGAFLGNEGGCRFNLSKGIASQIDWKSVDELDVQAQGLADDTTCGSENVSKYASFVSQIASIARAANPNIRIVSQVSLRFSAPATIIDAARAVRGIANAFLVAYPSNGCANCTAANLSAVLQAL